MLIMTLEFYAALKITPLGKSQIDDCIDVLTRLSRHFFSRLTYDPNDDALRFFAC